MLNVNECLKIVKKIGGAYIFLYFSFCFGLFVVLTKIEIINVEQGKKLFVIFCTLYFAILLIGLIVNSILGIWEYYAENKKIQNKYSDILCANGYEDLMVKIDHKDELISLVISNMTEILYYGQTKKKEINILGCIKACSPIIVSAIGILISNRDFFSISNEYDLLHYIYNLLFGIIIIYFFVMPFIIIQFMPTIPATYRVSFRYTATWYNMYMKGATTYNKPHAPHYKILKKIKKYDKNLFNKCMAKADLFGKRERINEIIKNKTYQLSYDETEELVRIFDDFHLQVKDFWLNKEYE